MLMRRQATILPDLTLTEALATTRIHSIAGLTGARTAVLTTCPFRAPHHIIEYNEYNARGVVQSSPGCLR